jgi:RNA-directed DNA polymerase
MPRLFPVHRNPIRGSDLTGACVMSDDKRAALRARINETSKDEVILDEMIRRGFWKETDGQPSLPAELIRRQGDVRREMESLAADANAYQDPKRALKLIQLERMKAARERRIETKLRHAKERHDRATSWHARKAKEITHLGDSVSAALNGVAGKPEKLASLKLPAIADAAAMATAMGIKIGELRFLAYDRKVAKVDHYARFTIPKRTGGVREISAPMPRLKRAQYWILVNILQPLQAHDAAHGFRAKRSILTNARPHTGRRVVINLDLKDFFPTISYKRVKGFFVALGYPEKVAVPLALLCTDAERDKLQVDGQTWTVARGERRLPQGAPTSPAIANLIANRLDKRMLGAARKLGFTYTRYADDMTFSGDVEPKSKAVSRLLWQLQKIAEAEGFTFNDQKTRIMGNGNRQDVTGLVVNQRPAVARHERRRFRSWLHNAEAAKRAGAALPLWTNAKAVPSDALGFAGYLAMVDARHGAPLLIRTKAIFFSTPAKPSHKAIAARIGFRAAAAAGKAPTDTWWTPAEPAAPQIEVVVKPKASAAAQATTASVPLVAGGRPAPQPRTRNPSPRSPSPSAQPAAADPPRSLLLPILKSLALLPVGLLPMVGPLIVIVGLIVIWRNHVRSSNP